MADDELHYEDFEHYFPHAPTALCIKECARLAVLRHYDCPGPILDVGCGDGLFARIAFEGAEIWGIDIDAKEGRWAQASRAYSQIILGDITRAHLPKGFFRTCVANCSLEHVPDIDAALTTIHDALVPGGRAYLFVPHRDWASHMLSLRTLRTIGARTLSKTLQDGIDQTFAHHHLYDESGWRQVVERAKFEIDHMEPVLSTANTVAFEMFLLPSLAGFVNKKLTTRWTNFPTLRRAVAPLAFALAKGALRAAHDTSPTAEFLIVARRPE
jgi:2-polyprenyl-3-methyl-5-hydroxy-6-metoxy-1,4-benzoquinol methylase